MKKRWKSLEMKKNIQTFDQYSIERNKSSTENYVFINRLIRSIVDRSMVNLVSSRQNSSSRIERRNDLSGKHGKSSQESRFGVGRNAATSAGNKEPGRYPIKSVACITVIERGFFCSGSR